MKKFGLLLLMSIIIMKTSCGSQNLSEHEPVQEAATYVEAAAEVYGVTGAAEVYVAAETYEVVEVYEEHEAVYVRHRTDLAQAGDIIEFGGYNWIVLDVYGDYAKIITENVLVIHYVHYGWASSMRIGMPYYSFEITDTFRAGGVFHYIHFPVTWSCSSLRRYLNYEFFNSFDKADRARIRETYVTVNDNPWFMGTTARLFDAYGGENTVDKIFILSVEEILQYFGDSGQLHNRPDGRITWIADEYNSARIATNKEGAPMWWWSRTPGNRPRLVAGVDVAGIINMCGMYANDFGGGTRPVLWLNLTGPWDQENFTDIREPLPLAYNTPHGQLAIQHLEFISDNLYSRIPFSYREKETAVWLVEELLAMGHHWDNIQVQEVPMRGDMQWWNLNNQPRWASDIELRETTRLTQNVIATIPGQSERKIIVGAHYDSLPYPGTSDNASGASVLLESAQRMLQTDNYYTIKYVFFGAHELGGLVTTDAFINSLTDEQISNIVLMVNVDNLLDGPYMFFGAAYNADWQPGSNVITQRIDEIAYELDLGLIGHPLLAFIYSDHFSFLARGHTVVFLMGLFGTEHPGVVGFFEIDGKEFVRGVSHTQNDDFHIIEARWPGMIQTNMQAFSVFLEEILTGLHLA